MNIKLLREKELKETQEVMASKLGVNRGTIAKIESGHSKPSNKLLDKIHEVYGVDVEPFKSYNKNKTYTTNENNANVVAEEEPIKYGKQQEKESDMIFVLKEISLLKDRVNILEKKILNETNSK